MYTCCPHCQTCFRITKAQLDVAQGKVRCGHCKQVFNGKQHLRDDLPGQQSKPAATPIPPPAAPVTPEPEPPKAEEDFGKATDIDFDLFDLSSIPESSEEEEDWFEDSEEIVNELEDVEPDAWLEEDEFEEEDVTADLDEPYEEIDEDEEETYPDTEAEVKPEEPGSQTASRYAYVDPEELRGE
ncbi:MAG: zinc-ribbon domain-containing protein, partial [Granulosicoccaceae bacterium]